MKKTYLIFILLLIITPAFAFEKGAVLNLKVDFSGALTNPSISEETLKYMNPQAVGMAGTLSGLLMGGEVEGGYIFSSYDIFEKLPKDNFFSGLGVFGYIGLSQGNASQKISAVQVNGDGSSVPFDIFMVVDYLPVIDFGITGKIYMFDNRFAIGLSVGGRVIADMSPQYLVYSTQPDVIKTEIGEVIVTEDMIKKMNPIMFSMRGSVEYAVPISNLTEVRFGGFFRYNMYRPKYLTLPPSLEAAANINRPGATDTPPSAELDFDQPFPDYWINSMDFGVSIGIGLKI